MNAREMIATLNHMLRYNQDVGEFEVVAWDADDAKMRPVTGLIWSHQRKQITMQTDEL